MSVDGTFYSGICPFCLNISEMEKGRCKFCGRHTHYHITSILKDIALKSGKLSVMELIIPNLPETCLTKQGTLINRDSLLGQLEFSDNKWDPSLIKTFIDEGKKTVRKLLEAKQKEIEKKYEILLDKGEIATIIILENFLNSNIWYYGETTPTIDIQMIADQELNENGEFVLFHKNYLGDLFKHFTGNGNRLDTASQAVEIREEKEGDYNSTTYIKGKKTPFVIIYRAVNHRPNSRLFIFV